MGPSQPKLTTHIFVYDQGKEPDENTVALKKYNRCKIE